MGNKLEKGLFNFEGRIDCIVDSENRPDYKFVRLISKDKQKWIGFAKTIPGYIEVGLTTKITFKLDEHREYLIVGYTVPGKLIT